MLENTIIEEIDESQLEPSDKKSERLLSLDALRGFDMFWLIGGTQMVVGLAQGYQWPWLKAVSKQMYHVKWEGFSFHDLIFPLFLFISAVTIPFSVISKIDKGVSYRKVYFHIAKRVVILILFGVIYNGGLKFNGLANTRIASVLGFIGIGYFFAAILAIHVRKVRWLLLITVFILVSYWAMLMFVPVPEVGAGILTADGSFAGYVDQLWLPGKLYKKMYDPQGILPCYSGIATALTGLISGIWLKRTDRKKWTKALGIFTGSIVCLLTAKIWAFNFPIIKNIWTSTFVLYSTGWSLLLLFLFYIIVDIWKIRFWIWPFIIIGVNSITIYMGAKVINFGHSANYLFGGLIHLLDKPLQPVMMAIAIFLCEMFFLFVLYKKKIFLKV